MRRISPVQIVLGLAAAAVAFRVLWPGETVVAGPAAVIDGDSLRIARREIRLRGLDAPERRQTCERPGGRVPCGTEAVRALRGLVAGRTVECRVAGRDRYGRDLGRCAADGEDLGARLVAEGHAFAAGAYRSEEAAARRAGRGVWAGPAERPADWRARHPH